MRLACRTLAWLDFIYVCSPVICLNCLKRKPNHPFSTPTPLWSHLGDNLDQNLLKNHSVPAQKSCVFFQIHPLKSFSNTHSEGHLWPLHHVSCCFLKCPYYGLWKVHILVLGVPNNRLTCMQGQKTLSFSYNILFFLPYLLNDSQIIRSTMNFSKPLLCVTLICGDWSISFKAVFVSF